MRAPSGTQFETQPPQFNRAIDPIETHMTLLKRCSAFFMAALLLSVLGCTSTPTRESTGEYLDDTVITTRVKTAIFNEPTLKVLQINVETYKNVVQLSGFVNSPADMNKAVAVARSVKGVASVKNDLRLR
jgi:hypothetical protein